MVMSHLAAESGRRRFRSEAEASLEARRRRFEALAEVEDVKGAAVRAKLSAEELLEKNKALYYKVILGNMGELESAIADGAEVDWHNPNAHQCTALHTAAWNYKLEAVAALISHGADLNARNKYGETPLMSASYEGHAKVVGALLDAGADIKLKNDGGYTALDLARKRRKYEVVALLERS